MCKAKTKKAVKAKTKKAVKARFKLTGSGKLVRKSQGRRHLLSKKSTKRKRRLKSSSIVTEAHAPLYKRLIKGV